MFADYLRDRLAEQGHAKRVVRTRLRLEIAATELLQDVGYHELKISTICDAADCGHGTFYRYWADREAVARDVMTDFMAAIRSSRPPQPPGTPLHERVLFGHMYYIEIFRLNAGLMRCLGQLNFQVPGFAEIGQKANRHLAERVLRAFRREGFARQGSSDSQDIALALGCIGLVDEMLRNIFINNAKIRISTKDLAVMFLQMWYRVFLTREPVVSDRAEQLFRKLRNGRERRAAAAPPVPSATAKSARRAGARYAPAE